MSDWNNLMPDVPSSMKLPPVETVTWKQLAYFIVLRYGAAGVAIAVLLFVLYQYNERESAAAKDRSTLIKALQDDLVTNKTAMKNMDESTARIANAVELQGKFQVEVLSSHREQIAIERETRDTMTEAKNVMAPVPALREKELETAQQNQAILEGNKVVLEKILVAIERER